MRDFTEILKHRSADPGVLHLTSAGITPAVELLGTYAPARPPEDIELAVKIGSFLDNLPASRSATANEIAEALFGKNCALDSVIRICQLSEELWQAGILVKGLDGYGYQLACWAKCRKFTAP